MRSQSYKPENTINRHRKVVTKVQKAILAEYAVAKTYYYREKFEELMPNINSFFGEAYSKEYNEQRQIWSDEWHACLKNIKFYCDWKSSTLQDSTAPAPF